MPVYVALCTPTNEELPLRDGYRREALPQLSEGHTEVNVIFPAATGNWGVVDSIHILGPEGEMLFSSRLGTPTSIHAGDSLKIPIHFTRQCASLIESLQSREGHEVREMPLSEATTFSETIEKALAAGMTHALLGGQTIPLTDRNLLHRIRTFFSLKNALREWSWWWATSPNGRDGYISFEVGQPVPTRSTIWVVQVPNKNIADAMSRPPESVWEHLMSEDD